ncbi:Nuclease precursor [compost metagenome]|uniref:DNA/RNA non-specific endonuclease n=1 Tax=Achromobacter sp. Root83 TaxID=1736602 RepID=UPI0009E756D8|nr:DNA/RNA non-specific endonuclease [Achromobacter sp. Root83]
MTRAKKSAPRKRTPVSRNKATRSGRIYRFLRTFALTSLASFGAATYALNPQWRVHFSPEDILARLGWPAQEQQFAPAPAPAGGFAHTRFADCPQFFPRESPPVVPASQALRELCFSSFAILHNGQTKTPVFVAERLNRKTLAQAQGMQRADRFYAEARIPRAERAELPDYRGSGYSRGHMAPAGDMSTPDAMAQSFSLANMVPQDQTQNAGAWSRIEQDTRKYVMRAAGDVYVFTGPFYAEKPKEIGSGVAVPSHIYKVVYDAATGRSWVHWQANSASTTVGAPIGYEEFVRRTGMKLLPPSAP